MGYRNLNSCINDLERHGHLVRITEPLSADLEIAEVHRRVYAAGGPALLFENVQGCSFPMVSNLFGTTERAKFIFRDALRAVRELIEAKGDPALFLRKPWRLPALMRTLWTMRPAMRSSGPVMRNTTTLDQLPQLKCWPDDGGAFVTLPEVFTEHPDRRGYINSNLGMYRVQISGNEYTANRECGIHYQIHRSIGQHHAAALARGESLPVNVFIGGPPSMILAAVMPLPEGIPEVAFAGAMSRHGIRMVRGNAQRAMICAEADFCISGHIHGNAQKPEGPFGDHLGYYSLTHDFPVMSVDKVYHRDGAIWPFTVVGRPPQEDTVFGELIHELTGPAIPTVLPGVHAVHAVDAAGVHPLLLAIGSERYVPYAAERQPQELLTNASAILGQGQLSLAKYLMIVAKEDDPSLDIHDIGAFLDHLLRRVDWKRDLHFITRTTIDTLDYSGTGLNEGSKVIIAAAGKVRRELPVEMPGDLHLPDGFHDPQICRPGILAVTSPKWSASPGLNDGIAQRFCDAFNGDSALNRFPLVLLVDDAAFCAESLNNVLWTVFTRSNPASDICGIDASFVDKHWGCRGSLVIDARIKAHHAPPLKSDPAVVKKVDALAVRGGPLHGLI